MGPALWALFSTPLRGRERFSISLFRHWWDGGGKYVEKEGPRQLGWLVNQGQAKIWFEDDDDDGGGIGRGAKGMADQIHCGGNVHCTCNVSVRKLALKF